jgi:pyruvate/2-oxoglutarate dehydrogenase complex dihydrolipoamide dehydrogenase (E3) component
MQVKRQAVSPNREASEVPNAESETLTPDICVIGGGPGGLSVAAAAAAFGRKVVLIERHKMGGDCLNYGCIPSKALLAAGKRAQAMRTASQFGITGIDPEIDPRKVHDHVHGVIAAIAPNDSIERYTGLGVRVILAAGRFIDKSTVIAGEHRIKARRFVLATGSAPLVPAIPGLDSVPYFTNETIFDNQQRLHDLIVIGAGPLGLELAQAHHRLGSRVTVLEAAKALGNEDPELSKIVLQQLGTEGINVLENTTVDRIESSLGRVRVHVRLNGETHVVEGSHLLLAAGRRPTTSDLGLEAARIRYDNHGIKVNGKLKTSNRRVYAIGDCVGGAQFTHVADYHAEFVVRRILFKRSGKVGPALIPRVTFTDPELAHVGLSEAEAQRSAGKINVLRWPYHENDRAQAEHESVGHIKVVTARGGRILGAMIVGAQAGELIQMWALAISQKLNVKALTEWISPFPTLGAINKSVAERYYATAPSNPAVRKLIGFLARFG